MAGVVGNVAGQVVGSALGVHEGFSLKEALTSGLITAATAGLGSYLQGSSSLMTVAQDGTPVFNTGGRAIMAGGQYLAGNAAGQITGEQHHFSFAWLVASAAAAV